MLRPHEVFQSPLPVNLAASIRVDTPAAWKHSLDEPTVEILPLVDDLNGWHRDGWCTYTYKHSQAPELEVICGGVNAKIHTAAAIWRQGHLLHFGFEQSPAEMNDNGRALLVNSICYIARFTEDRPLVRTPSVFYSKVKMTDRGFFDRLVKRLDRDLDTNLQYYLAASAQPAVRGMSRDELAAWYRENRGFLQVTKRGKFAVDEAAREFGVAVDGEQFIPKSIAAWREEGPKAELARQLLDRYVHCGPGPSRSTSPDDWQGWWRDNRPYLFFSDTGGFGWQIDELARKRGVSSSSLRGPQRASRPAVQPVESPRERKP